jgi:thiol-disulfide isomerase/thioredoxin
VVSHGWVRGSVTAPCFPSGPDGLGDSLSAPRGVTTLGGSGFKRLIARGLALAVLALCPLAVAAGEISERSPAPAPDLRLPDLSGRERGLAEFQGKVLLVNFWASWCSPCVEEMPSLERLADQMRGKPFALVGVNVEESRFRAMTMAQRLKLGFPVLLDAEGAVFKRWGATVLPTTYVLDAKGLVRYVAQGPIDWDGAEVLAIIQGLADAAARAQRPQHPLSVQVRPAQGGPG